MRLYEAIGLERLTTLIVQSFLVLLLCATSSPAEPKPGEIAEIKIAADVKMKFCWIPDGEAKLGAPKEERSKVWKSLSPTHPAKMSNKLPEWLLSEAEEKRGKFKSNGFWMGKFLVTQGEWTAIVGSNPSYFNPKLSTFRVNGIKDTSRFPVDSVSWEDCHDFLDKLNEKKVTIPAIMGKGTFSLPHEDAWEYACRGGKGNKQAFYFGDKLDGTDANCCGLEPFGTAKGGPFLGRTSEVGSYEKLAPHPWGLCDMHGNVRQWCSNKYRGGKLASYVIMKGGCWATYPRQCRAASRIGIAPEQRHVQYGFRIVFAP